MPKRIMHKKNGRKRRLVGSGLWDTIKGWLSSAHNFVKDNKLISRGLSAYSKRPGNKYGPAWGVGASIAQNLGYGRKSLKGAGIMNYIRKKYLPKYVNPQKKLLGSGRSNGANRFSRGAVLNTVGGMRS